MKEIKFLRAMVYDLIGINQGEVTSPLYCYEDLCYVMRSHMETLKTEALIHRTSSLACNENNIETFLFVTIIR